MKKTKCTFMPVSRSDSSEFVLRYQCVTHAVRSGNTERQNPNSRYFLANCLKLPFVGTDSHFIAEIS